MKTTPYNKLVRDKIPDIIQASGKIAVVETLSSENYIKKLNTKLQEELNEYLESEDIEELADLAEVLIAILTHKDVSTEKFEQIRIQKRQKRGGFEKRLLLLEVREDEE